MAYRDDVDALEHRRAHLAEELAQIDEALAEADTLAKRRGKIARQLAAVQSRLHARLPLIDRARAASPCSARWELMEGDARARRCQACGKRVFNVSGLSRAEATRLITAHGAGKRLRRREDGTLIDGDCPLGARIERRGHAVVSIGTVALVGAGLIVAASTPAPRPTKIDPNAVDGAAAFTPIEVDDEVEVTLGLSEKPDGDPAEPVAQHRTAPGAERDHE